LETLCALCDSVVNKFLFLGLSETRSDGVKMPLHEVIRNLKGYINFLKESDFILLEEKKGRTSPAEKQASHTPPKSHPTEMASRVEALKKVADSIAVCTSCRLSLGRINTVPGDGHPLTRVVFVGEAPGYHEDQQGLPFVGRAGKLLERLLAGIGLMRQEVFICNVVKCRPPENREPLPDEILACEPYLLKQIDILKPLVICALGRLATHILLRTNAGINTMRGRFFPYHGILLMPTLHPAALLRNPIQLPDVERDFKLLSAKLKEITGQNV